eukprot:1360415-Pyramimonas_sp.AAC.1
MGWPVIQIPKEDAKDDDSLVPKPNPYSFFERIFSEGPSIKSCALGNGMHLAAEEAWVIYTASNTIRRDVLSSMAPPLSAPSSSSAGTADSVPHQDGRSALGAAPAAP